MPDAEVIPLGGRGEPGRGSGRRSTPSAASRSLAGTGTRSSRPTRRTPGDPGSANGTAVESLQPARPTPAQQKPAQQAQQKPAQSKPAQSKPARRKPARRQPTTQTPAKQTPATQTSAARTSAAQTSAAPATAGQTSATRAPEGPPAARPDVAPRRPSDGALVDLARWVGEVAGEVLDEDAQADLARALALLRRRLTGDYAVDDYGFDAELTETLLLPALRPLYSRWFRVEARGLENIPSEGGALVVSNHSGAIALDSLMIQLAVHDEHPAHRTLRALGADFVFRMPVVGELARKSGATLACTDDAQALLEAGELVGVWPEGFKGIGKPFAERYQLQRFGRGGFVSAALRTGTPIVPCAVVGAEETYPVLGNMPTLARLLGVPYVPVTPTFPLLGLLGVVPLPSKWILQFGEPVDTSAHPPGAADDPMLTFDITDQVRETIQQTLYALLQSRRRTFF